jgi:hypothetical protein
LEEKKSYCEFFLVVAQIISNNVQKNWSLVLGHLWLLTWATENFWSVLVTKLSDRKFGHPNFWAMPLKKSITFLKKLGIQWTLV